MKESWGHAIDEQRKTEPTSKEQHVLLSVEETMNEMIGFKDELVEIMKSGDSRLEQIAMLMEGKRHTIAYRVENFALEGAHSVEDTEKMERDLKAFTLEINTVLHMIDESSRNPAAIMALLNKLKSEAQ